MTLRHLIPTLAVVIVAILGPALDHPDPCVSTDGPQFACWLERQGS